MNIIELHGMSHEEGVAIHHQLEESDLPKRVLERIIIINANHGAFDLKHNQKSFIRLFTSEPFNSKVDMPDPHGREQQFDDHIKLRDKLCEIGDLEVIFRQNWFKKK